MDTRTNEQLIGRMDGWMNGCRGGRMDTQTHEAITYLF